MTASKQYEQAQKMINIVNKTKGTDLRIVPASIVREITDLRGAQSYAYAGQEVMDAVFALLYDKYGFRHDRLVRFKEQFEKLWSELRGLENVDLELRRGEVEEVLKAGFGTDYEPFDERYYREITWGGKVVDVNALEKEWGLEDPCAK